MAEGFEKKLVVEDFDLMYKLFGKLDENIIKIESEFKVKLASRDGEIAIIGEESVVDVVWLLLNKLLDAIQSGEILDRQKLEYYILMVKEGEADKLASLTKSIICVTSRGKYVKPKTLGQQKYIESIQRSDVTFGVGPAGTGKTYLAVAMAVKAFKNEEVTRIIITRPAVEAGENLGFLPGDLQSKVDPYLRPLYDALYDILGGETFLKFKERGLIEIAPLAYMRGRTLDNAFIILDEAQNTSNEQMKMFLTRFGFGSKVVVNGDITQIDLPKGRKSGLVTALEVLREVDGIDIVKFSDKDVVRHSLVKRIIQAYDRYEKRQAEKFADPRIKPHSKGREVSK